MTRSICQLTLVAFFGKKEENELWEKIGEIQSKIKNVLQNNYEPYDDDKIHGTIVGLEGAILEGRLIGKNYIEIENKEVSLEIDKIINFINGTDLVPMEIKIGGFKDINDKFTSRGEIPFNRSFSIQKNVIVVMGWPFSNGNYSPVLNTLRRRLSQFGALHKYYNKPNSYDNDFFFVLGNLKSSINAAQKNELLSIRDDMAKWKNITADITNSNIRIIKYKDTKFKECNCADSLGLAYALEQIESLKNSYPIYDYAVNWLNTP